MKRLNYLDFIKGIGIILVIVGHIPSVEKSPLGLWIYSFHVPLFFIVSGYLIEHMNEKFNIYKKIKSLLYPYIVFSVLSILFGLFLQTIKGVQLIDIQTSIIKTLTFEGYSTLWFLPTLFFAELLFYFFKSLMNNKTKYMCILLFCASLVLTHFINIIDSTIIIRVAIVFNRIIIACSFVSIGSIIYNLIKSAEKNKILGVLSFFVLFSNMFLCQINGFVDLHFSIINNYAWYYYLAITTTFSLIYIGKFFYKGKLKLSKFIEFLGKNSLLIMVTHLPFMILGTVFGIINLGNVFLRAFITTIIVLVIEGIIILVVNKAFKFLLDPKYFKIYISNLRRKQNE